MTRLLRTCRISLVPVTDVRRLLTLAAIAALLPIAGCNNTTTGPSSGSPSGTPVVLGTIPSQPSLSDLPQVIQVNGHDFDTGMTASVQRPDGRPLSFVAGDLRQFTSSSFQVSVVLDVAGNYTLELKNASGLTSPPFTLTVGSAAQGSLTLTSVTPSTTVASASPQGIVVSGANFDASLEVLLTAPDSSTTFYESAAMTGLNSTSFSLNVVLSRVGTYTLVVRNSSNSTSNPLTIDVRRTF